MTAPQTQQKSAIYAVRTTSGQERTVVDLMASKAKPRKLPIYAILAPEVIKGYIFVEADGPHFVDEAIAGTRHARARTRGVVSISAIERFIITKPVIEELKVGDTVEVVGGPFRGLKAKITSIDKVKQEVVIELLEEGFATLPITVHADYVKLASRGSAGSGGEESGREEAS
ncbi:MAG TPA: transcription elongation factor Spt5 [Candidatus Binatus sp.]|nr:transcription elongation factor Spt5 [Candidatus Binatus sp.]